MAEDEQSDDNQTMLAKLIGVVAALIAAWAAQQTINAVWRAAVGHKPPKPEEEGDDISFAEIAAATALSGALVAVARVAATRGAARWLN